MLHLQKRALAATAGLSAGQLEQQETTTLVRSKKEKVKFINFYFALIHLIGRVML